MKCECGVVAPLIREKQIRCGNDRKKSKNKDNNGQKTNDLFG